MGEIAEMMLDGTLCEGCGEFIGGDGDGIPRYCSRQCAAGRGITYAPPRSTAKANKAARVNRERQEAAGRVVPCSDCTKKFHTEAARDQHYRVKHGTTENAF